MCINRKIIVFTGRNEVVAKVMFLQVCVCPQGGRVSASVHAGMPYPPPRMENPPRMESPRWRTPPNGEPPRMENPPQMEEPTPHPPRPREADSSIRSTSGRYASYWNAFLFILKSGVILTNLLFSCTHLNLKILYYDTVVQMS